MKSINADPFEYFKEYHKVIINNELKKIESVTIQFQIAEKIALFINKLKKV